MSRAHGFEVALLRGLQAAFGVLPRAGAQGFGAGVGSFAHLLGLRRSVAAANLALAFPEKPQAERDAILTAHYRDLGMVLAEYGRPLQTHHALGDIVAEIHGLEHLERARQAGKGVVLLTGHYGNFGLLAAAVGQHHPVDIAGKPIENPGVEALLVEISQSVGIGRIRFDRGARKVFTALKENRCVMLLADQDAGQAGAFVPFFGRPTSTWTGPASISLRTGAPLVMAFATRRADGRHVVDVLPALTPPAPGTPEGDVVLTATHTAALERQVRAHPPMWFWLHRRWKTVPRANPEAGVAAAAAASAAAAAAAASA